MDRIGGETNVNHTNYICPVCGANFYTKHDCDRHNRRVHEQLVIGTRICVACGYMTTDPEDMETHEQSHHRPLF